MSEATFRRNCTETWSTCKCLIVPLNGKIRADLPREIDLYMYKIMPNIYDVYIQWKLGRRSLDFGTEKFCLVYQIFCYISSQKTMQKTGN